MKKSLPPPEVLDIRQFILIHGFINASVDIINTVASLVEQNIRDGHIVMRYAYEEIAASKNPNAVRIRLSYYIKNNHDAVRQSIHKKYGYDIGEYYGVKSFINQITNAYMIFYLSSSLI